MRFMKDRAMKGITPVVRVGCQIKDKVYQKMKVGSLRVWLGSTTLVPLDSLTVISMNLGMFREKERTVTGTTYTKSLFALDIV